MERIRSDSPEAKPILARRDALTALAESRHAEMHAGQTKDLTHPHDLLTSEERAEFHQLGLRLREKTPQEAREDILERRKLKL